jgi:phage terminase large subunit GpA-like protein
MIEFAEIQRFKDVAELKARHNAAWIFLDLGYTERRNECLEQCLYGDIKGAIPMFGRDTLKEVYTVRKDYDPFEGTAKQGRTKMPMVTFNPDTVKGMLARLIDATDPHQWMIPSDTPAEYIRQVTAEECIDGAWVKRRRDNHAFDLECMGLVAAMVLGVFRQVGLDLAPAQATAATTAQDAPVKRRRPGVYMPD